MDIPEINYKIISYLHPYYLQTYCLSNKELTNKCDSYLYDLLQIWVMPDKSTRDISLYFPNITLKQVVDLALVYYPIPESVGKYDLYTLLYHACRTNQSDLSYLFNGYMIDRITWDSRGSGAKIIGWIAYKFGRIDVLDSFYQIWSLYKYGPQLNTFQNMIMIKLGGKAARIGQPITNSPHFFSGLEILLSPEEILESIIVAHLARCITKGDNYYLMDYLTGFTKVTPPALETDIRLHYLLKEYNNYMLLVGTLVNSVGINKLDEIIVKYYPTYIPTKSDRIYPNYPELLTGREGSTLWYYNHPEYTEDIEKFIAYYLTSGDYIRYIHALNSGAKLDLQSETIIGTFPMKYMSMNQDFEIQYKKRIYAENPPIILDPSTYSDRYEI